jgi:hypothetical protein
VTNGERLRAACRTLNWSASSLAGELQCNPRLVQRWWAEEPGYYAPDEVVEWAERIAGFLRDNPPPEWKRQRVEAA